MKKNETGQHQGAKVLDSGKAVKDSNLLKVENILKGFVAMKQEQNYFGEHIEDFVVTKEGRSYFIGHSNRAVFDEFWGHVNPHARQGETRLLVGNLGFMGTTLQIDQDVIHRLLENFEQKPIQPKPLSETISAIVNNQPVSQLQRQQEREEKGRAGSFPSF